MKDEGIVRSLEESREMDKCIFRFPVEEHDFFLTDFYASEIFL